MAYDVDHIGTYDPTVWENYTSTKTPLNAANLNKIDNAIDVLDDEAYLSRERVDALGTRVNNLDTEVQQFDTRITTNTNNIRALRNSVNTLDSRVTNLEEEITDLDISARLDELEDVSVGGIKKYTHTETAQANTNISFIDNFVALKSLTAMGTFTTGTVTFAYRYSIRHADGSYGALSNSSTVTIDDTSIFKFDSFSTEGIRVGDIITAVTIVNSSNLFDTGTQLTLTGRVKTDESQTLQDGDLLTYDITSELWVNKPMPEVDFGLFVEDGILMCRYESD